MLIFLVRVWNTQTGQLINLRNLLGYPAYDMVLVEDKLVTTHETYFTIWNPYDFYVYQGKFIFIQLRILFEITRNLC
jgi:hypothetical protein